MKKIDRIKQSYEIQEHKTQLVQTFLKNISTLTDCFVLKGGASVRLLELSNRHSQELDIAFLKNDFESVQNAVSYFNKLILENKEFLGIKYTQITTSHNCYIFQAYTSDKEERISMDIHKEFYDPIIDDAKYFIYNNIKIQEIEKSIAEKISVLCQKISVDYQSEFVKTTSVINAFVDLFNYNNVTPIDLKRVKEILEKNFTVGKFDQRNKDGNTIFFNIKSIEEIYNYLIEIFSQKRSNRGPLFTKKDFLIHEVEMRYKNWGIIFTEKNFDDVLKFIEKILKE